MEAVGSEVFIAIAFPLITLTSLGLYYRQEIR